MRRASLVVFTVVSGCGEPAAAPSADAECPPHDVMAALSDYQNATTIGALGPASATLRTPSIEFGADLALRVSAGRAFTLNRADAVVLPLDGACGAPLGSRILVSPSQQRWNPQDVACAPDGALWIPFYNQSILRMLPAGAQDGDPGVLDLPLGGYDTDGKANASSAVTLSVGGAPKVFVSLGRLDDEYVDPLLVPPKQSGLLVRFDTTTRTADATFELAGWNPFGQIQVVRDLLLFSMAGNVGVGDETNAGIELYDPARNVSRIIATERDLGGSLSQVAVQDECGAAIVFGPEQKVNPTELVTFRAPTSASLDAPVGTVLARKILVTPGYDLQGLAWQGRTLYVGDRRKLQAGYAVHKYERAADSCDLHATGSVIVPIPPVALLPTLTP